MSIAARRLQRSKQVVSGSSTQTNYFLNPRAVGGQSGLSTGGKDWGSSSTYAVSFRTGQTGWANATTTDVAIDSGGWLTYYDNGYGTAPAGAYTLGFQFLSPVACTLSIQIEWYDSGGGNITSGNLYTSVSVIAGVNAVSQAFTKPAGAESLRLLLDPLSVAAGSTIAATNFVFGASSFFDGNTPDTASDTYSWTGAVNQSFSTWIHGASGGGGGTGAFYTSGGYVYAPDGSQFNAIGANVGMQANFCANGYTTGDYQGVANGHSSDVLAWGWNAIRIPVLTTSYHSYSLRANYGLSGLMSRLDVIIQEYTAKKIVVMVDCHDLWGLPDGSSGINSAWISQLDEFWQAMAAAYKNNTYVWFDLHNEPPVENQAWIDLHVRHIQMIRAAGARNILVVGAPGWGQDTGPTGSFPGSKFAYDPSMAPYLSTIANGNLVLSQHTYGTYTTNAALTTYIDTVHAAGLPLLFGEFGYTTDGSTTAGSYTSNYNGAQAVMSVGRTKGCGMFWWCATHNDKYSLKTTNNAFFSGGSAGASLSPAGTAYWGLTH